jgi:hypothetical protein
MPNPPILKQKFNPYAGVRSKVGAIKAYDQGVPSALSDSNPWKHAVEQHRWGAHGETADLNCPICIRNERKES